MALSTQQTNFNKLPYEEQQKQIKATYVNTGMQGRDAFDTKALQNNAMAQRNAPPAQRVNEAIKATTGTQPVNIPQSVPQNNNTPATVPPSQVVSNANNNVPKVNPALDFNKGYEAAKNEYKTTTSGMMSKEDAQKYYDDKQANDAEIIRARVRAAIQQGVSEQQKIITNAPQQFVNPMNNADFQGAKNARAIDERMAAMGLGRSGSNITAQTSNQNQTQANLNDLENTKAKVISDANAAIANLQAQGSVEEVRQVAERANANLEALQSQINAIDNRTNEQATAIFNNTNNALKTSYDIGSTERQLGMQQQGLDDARNNANRTYDLQNKIYNTGTDQWNKTFTQDQTNNDRTYGLQKDSAALNKMNTMAGLTGQIPANELIAQMSPTQIEAYKNLANQSGGYAAAMNATTDPVQKAIINEFRNQFLQQNPNNPYTNTQTATSMVPTMQGRQAESSIQTDAVQRAGLEISNKLNNLKLEAYPDEQKVTIDTAKVLLDTGRQDLAIKLIQGSNLDAKLKAEIAQTAESIAASQAQTANETKKTNYETNKPYYDPNRGSSAQKQSPYFGDISKNIDSFVTNLSDNGLTNNLSIPGSVEHRNFSTTVSNAIKNGLITRDEGEYFFNQYNVPFGGVQTQQMPQQQQSVYTGSIGKNSVPSNYQVKLTENTKKPKNGFGDLNNLVR